MTPKLRACLALALVMPATLSASPQPPLDTPEAILIGCANGNGMSFGTAWRADKGTIVTAAHVIGSGRCYARGPGRLALPLEVLTVDGALDLATLKFPSNDPALKIDCGKVKAGRRYFAIGYALGIYRMKSEVVATGEIFNHPAQRGMAVFRGNAIPGMSGGPVMYRGKVIAIVNAGNSEENRMIGRMLRDTPLCKGQGA
jgi:S1-C subfamily serine protease